MQTPSGDQTRLEAASYAMSNAMRYLQNEVEDSLRVPGGRASHELTQAINYLEIAMMFCNKDRTNKGYLKPYPTHNKVGGITE